MADSPQPIEILLVEPNARFVEAARRAFAGAQLGNNLHVVSNGGMALDFLYQRGEYQNAPRPDLVLLDPAITGPDGWTVLSEIKTDPELREIPVVLQTTSRSEMNLLKSYNIHDRFISRPIDGDEFLDAVRSIGGFGVALIRQDG